MKNVLVLFVLSLGLFYFTSCQKDSVTPNKGKVDLIIKSTKSTQVKSSANYVKTAANVNSFTLETFKVNIAEIEFGIDEDAEGCANIPDSVIDAQELDGPFLVDLLSQQALDGLNLGSTLIPNAVYEEIEFELDRCIDNTKPEMYRNSVYITGKINDKPLKFWSNEELEFEIEFPDKTNFTLEGNSLKIYIDFSIGEIVKVLNTYDFSSAKDGNNNGTIEIGPNDVDGNNALAHKIIEALEGAIDLDRDND